MKMRFPLGLLALVLMPVVAIGVSWMAGGFQDRSLKVLSELPDFELQDRRGGSISKEDLAGKVWIASFLFTRCSEQCPRLLREVKKIQNDLKVKEDIRFVSITVDPANDSLEVLNQYARKMDADSPRWFFLRGEPEETKTLLEKGFRLATAVEGNTLIHSSHLVLIDAWGRIRGYYDAMEADQVKRLNRDARRLLKEVFN